LNEETIERISMIFLNTGLYGSKAGSKKEKNKFKNYFDENNRLNKLLNLFIYLISQTLSPIQKDTINNISITICRLLKNERPSHCYGCVLEYVNDFRSSPSPTSGYNFHSEAEDSRNKIKMLEADGCLPENFSVKNGVLGLDQDVYLSIVFLDLSIVGKVRINTFLLFNLCFL
jgi:hypothetical protein